MSGVTVEGQVAQCYREHTPAQEQWLRWARWMKARGRASEVAGGLPPRQRLAA